MKKVTPNNIDKIILLLLIFVNIAFLANAQISSPGPDPNSAPVDGGLSLLVAGGIGYGVRKMREKKRNQEKEIDN